MVAKVSVMKEKSLKQILGPKLLVIQGGGQLLAPGVAPQIAAFIRAESGSINDPSKTFPPVRTLKATALQDSQAAALVKVIKKHDVESDDLLSFKFDPSRHLVFTVTSSKRKGNLYLNALDRKTGQVQSLAQTDLGDLRSWSSAKVFAKAYPHAPPLRTLSVSALRRVLLEGGTKIPLK